MLQMDMQRTLCDDEDRLSQVIIRGIVKKFPDWSV